MKIAVMYSGGLDSLILHHYARTTRPEAEVSAVWWDHGHKAAEHERAHLPDFVQQRRLDWLSLPVAGGYTARNGHGEAAYIPGRNLVFAVLTACQELADEVWLGSLVNEGTPANVDRNPVFQALAGATLTYVLGQFVPGVKVRAPLAEAGFDKFAAIEWALRNAVSRDALLATWSCYRLGQVSTDLPCGVCGQCVRRFLIFGALGMTEPTDQHPLLADQSRDWLAGLIEAADRTNWTGDPFDRLLRWFGRDERWVDFLIRTIRRDCPDDTRLLRIATALADDFRPRLDAKDAPAPSGDRGVE